MQKLSISTASSILLLSTRADGYVFQYPRITSFASKTELWSTTIQQPTRFDNLKKKYKGVLTVIDEESVPFSYEEFESAVQSTDYSFNRNDVVKGTIVSYDSGGAIIDIGAKASAFLPPQEVSLVPQATKRSIAEVLELESEQEVMIISEEDENGQLLVSIKRIEYQRAWDTVAEMQTNDETFDAEVVAINRGGAICLVKGLRAFLPGSHLAGQMPTEDLIGQELPLKFLEVTQDQSKLVVSNRRAVVDKQMNDLSRGDVIEGVVKALKPYGAFVQVGGMSGLLHISQISYDRIDDLETVVQVGMNMKCMIIDHDKVNGRIALSTKTLEPEPGDMLKDPQRVFDLAEQSAESYHQRMEAERKAREQQTKNIVLGLGDTFDEDETSNGDDENNDPLKDVSDSLDSILSD
jgi:small subunit ribosomal protein S1